MNTPQKAKHHPLPLLNVSAHFFEPPLGIARQKGHKLIGKAF
jgi:hypothetical protein